MKLQSDTLRDQRIAITSRSRDALETPRLAARSRTSSGRDLRCTRCRRRPRVSLKRRSVFPECGCCGLFMKRCRTSSALANSPSDGGRDPLEVLHRYACVRAEELCPSHRPIPATPNFPFSLHWTRENIWEKINLLWLKVEPTSQRRAEKDTLDRHTHRKQSAVAYGEGSAAWTRSGTG